MQQPVRQRHPGDMSGIRHASPYRARSEPQPGPTPTQRANAKSKQPNLHESGGVDAPPIMKDTGWVCESPVGRGRDNF